MLDLTLAVFHHLLVFSLLGVLAVELARVRPGMSGAEVAAVATIDLGYGVLAALILLVGFGRAVFAAKGWTYYAHNAFFWAKLGVFAVIGLLSIIPTVAFIRWRRSGAPPTHGAAAAVRGVLWSELALFALLPAFAAAMARGYGEF